MLVLGLLAAATTVAGNFVPRQAASTRTSAPAATSTPAPTGGGGGAAVASLSFASTGPSAVPLASITASASPAPTHPLKANLIPTPGATPPVTGAPVLPAWTFTPGSFPALDQIPDVNSPQVQQWVREVQSAGVQIPNLSVTVGDAACAANAQAAADTSRCWWTCGQCTRPTDITVCPDKLTWGVSFDDGPSEYTPDLLNFMDDVQLKSTFFIVGSRAISRPEILQAEYMAGHQLSVHTWSHRPLTTLTTEQIIAELGWTREAIRQITGVSPNTMRPPYGDIDDRVRAISQAMGMTPIIWTGTGTSSFDTNDWHIASGVPVSTVVQTFDSILDTAANLNTGFIVLAHDLYQQTVQLATGYILPDALARRNPQFNLMSIIQCLKKPLSDAYVETNNNQTNPSQSRAVPSTGTAAVTATPAGQSNAATASAGTQSGAVGMSVGRGVLLGAVVGMLAMVLGVAAVA